MKWLSIELVRKINERRRKHDKIHWMIVSSLFEIESKYNIFQSHLIAPDNRVWYPSIYQSLEQTHAMSKTGVIISNLTYKDKSQINKTYHNIRK